MHREVGWDVLTFSADDEKLLRFLWPLDLERPLNFTYSGYKNVFTLQFDNPGGEIKPYQRIRIQASGSTEEYVKEGVTLLASGRYSSTMSVNSLPGPSSGGRYIRVRGESYGVPDGEVVSPWSSWFYVNVSDNFTPVCFNCF